jgi:ADP-heptose:LPS heptosyltransferase
MRLIVGLTEHIGDIVACEPVSRYLRQTYPDAKIDWAVFDKYRELIDTNPYIDGTVSIDCLTDWIKLYKHGAYDKVIDLHVNYRVCPHCNIPLIKAHGNPFVNVYQWFDYGALLEAFSQGAGLPRISGQPKLYLNDEHIKAVDLLTLEEDYFVIHRTSNDPRKDYIDQYWLKLIDIIIAETGLTAIEIGTLGEDIISPLGDRVIDLRDKTSILQSAEIIRRSKFFIGVDSGPAHMANALYVPGIILLGQYHVFRRYNPFTGFYASNSPCVKIVRNELGPVRELPLNNIIEATRYVISNLNCTQTPAHDLSAYDIVVDQLIYDSGSNYQHRNSEIDFSPEVYKQTAYNAIPGEPRIFAFYLPQFHPIAENNKGHRPGFTEWDNVIASKPLFRGHNQPRRPGELGYYDLRSVEVMRDQIRLANDHGISGFCFYYYYFQGHKLLHTPIDNYIKSDIKAPFSLFGQTRTGRDDGTAVIMIL